MPAFHYIEDLDSVFSKLDINPIVVNDIDCVDQKNRQRLKEIIYTKFRDELISCIPRCECGATYGAYKVSTTCPDCGNKVVDPFDQTIEPIVWIRKPNQVTKLINPKILLQLRDRFQKNGFNYIEYLINPHYHTNGQMPPEFKRLMDNGLKRGYNNFIENFDEIFYSLLLTQCTKSRPPEEDDLYKEVQQYREIIFCNYISLPNRSLLTVEESSTGTYVNKDMGDCLEAAALMCGIDTGLKCLSSSKQQANTAKALLMLCNHNTSIYKNIYNKKSGLPRKHIYGGRIMFSARAVITSINEKHEYDEIHLGWNISIHLMYVHLMSKLLKAPYKMRPRKAKHFILSSTDNYNPTIAKLLDELIEESEGGIRAIYQRNPSLQRGSVQSRRITRFLKNPTENVIRSSPFVVKAHNADYDGDEMNVFLALDDNTAEAWIELEPHKAMFDINSYRTMSNDAALTKPTVSITNNWMLDTIEPTEEQINFMKRISKGDI